jgi:Family of unknown function (DUF6167)
MSRLTWFAAGAVTGVYGLVRARRAAYNVTPDGIAARLAAFGVALRTITSEVSAGITEREEELRGRRSPVAGDVPDQPGIAPTAVPPMIEPGTHPQPRHRREQEPDTVGHR